MYALLIFICSPGIDSLCVDFLSFFFLYLEQKNSLTIDLSLQNRLQFKLL
jgi:hypothetical protein